ncbi:NAD-dependent epimerase/dehydratase family protein [Candidatus Uhrbacteria bacterium]|nr:NAD-dependent epimerase/dehydratase family protein [Candidatus Uhrbacteria bacterium]
MSSRIPRIAERTNILVVGGAGFLGSHLCEFLLEKHNVICVDTYFSGKEQNIDHLLVNPHFEFIRHDIREPLDFKLFKGLERFRVAHIGVQHIYYLAGSVSPTVYLKHPVDVSMTCSAGTRNILDLAVEWRARLLFLSNAVLYGTVTEGPISEDQGGELDWRSPEEWYPSALRFGESLVEMYRATYSLETKIVRLFQTYGPRMHFDDGRFIPELIRAHLHNEEIVIDERFVKASCLYISDAVDALEKIMLTEKGAVYNLGSPTSYSIDELIAAVARLTGSEPRVRRALLDQDAALRIQYAWIQHARTPNMTLLRDAAAWFPVVLLEEGLQKTIDYMKALRGIRRINS